MKKNKKGFTLIELLVVISIISLLSSVVMAGMTSARNKAKQNAFRSEIMQFVNALELYRNDHGNYPFEQVYGTDPFYYIINNNNTASPNTDYPDFKVEMDKYMKTLPNPRGNNANPAFYYWRNNIVDDKVFRCAGSLTTPKYTFIIPSFYWGSNFEDWPLAEYYAFDDELGVSSWNPVGGWRCFSLN